METIYHQIRIKSTPEIVYLAITTKAGFLTGGGLNVP
jgi:hypothetical protein